MDHDKTNIKTIECCDSEMGDFEINYGTRKLEGNEHAYVTVTVDGGEEFGGCTHDLVLKHAPQLAELVKLHLTYVTGEPMHYIENAKYWWEMATGTSGWTLQYGMTEEDAADNFRKTVNCGVLGMDRSMPQPEDEGGDRPWNLGIQRILEHRRGLLREYTTEVLDRLMA